MMDIKRVKRELIGNLDAECEIFGLYIFNTAIYNRVVNHIKAEDNKENLLKIGRDMYFIAPGVVKQADKEYETIKSNTRLLKIILLKNLEDVISGNKLNFGSNDRYNPDPQINPEMEADVSLYEYVPSPYDF